MVTTRSQAKKAEREQQAADTARERSSEYTVEDGPSGHDADRKRHKAPSKPPEDKETKAETDEDERPNTRHTVRAAKPAVSKPEAESQEQAAADTAIEQQENDTASEQASEDTVEDGSSGHETNRKRSKDSPVPSKPPEEKKFKVATDKGDQDNGTKPNKRPILRAAKQAVKPSTLETASKPAAPTLSTNEIHPPQLWELIDRRDLDQVGHNELDRAIIALILTRTSEQPHEFLGLPPTASQSDLRERIQKLLSLVNTENNAHPDYQEASRSKTALSTRTEMVC